MIMDATPSPQSVGREFVRQYYTLLNKAPDHLHRFYNNHSSFVHGGLEPHNREATLVIGQKQIYNKIQQLNFRDCHAKISQVDAQSTLGNGVVVQVTGELSNDGQPMRRFTQTFVLAAQSPKKYYVHNDIFRYQDLISDDEGDGESRSEHDEEQDQDATATVVENNNQTNNSITAQQPQQIFYPLGVNPVVQSFQPQPPQMNGVVQHDEIIQTIPPTQNNNNNNNNNNTLIQGTTIQTQAQTQAPQAQPVIPVEQLSTGTPSAPIPPTSNSINDLVTEQTKANPTVPSLHNDIDATSQNDVVNAAKIEPEVTQENSTGDQAESVREEVPKPAQNEPKTYAHFFKSDNINSGMSFASAMSSNQSLLNNTTGRTTSSNTNTNSTYPSRTAQQDLRVDSTSNTLTGSRSSSSRPGQIKERRSSNANQFSDNHQLFLGNVPHHATEEELKIMFGRFGSVADLRIHSKSGPKVPGMRAPPNYGFITYDDPESVQNCLSNLPLFYPENSPDGQRLNVEEKKTRMRNESSNNVGGTDRNDRDRNDRGDRGDRSERGLNRTVSGGQRGSGDRDGPRGVGANRTVNSGGMIRGGPPGVQRTGGNISGSGNRGPFNRNDRQQQGPRGNNNGTSNTSNLGGSGGSGGSYGRR